MTGLSSDTKPTNVATNTEFFETNTNSNFNFNGSTWDEITGGGGGDQTPITQDVDYDGFDIEDLGNSRFVQSTSGTDIDFAEDEFQSISISADTLFTTANRVLGRSKVLKITTDITQRLLTWPEWNWISEIPPSQAPSTNSYLELTCWGPDDTDIEAKWTQAIIPDVSQDYIDAIASVAPFGSPALSHNQDPSDGSPNNSASGVIDVKWDLQTKLTRPLKAKCGNARSPYIAGTWEVLYSDDDISYTSGDSIVQSANGTVLLDAGSPSFRYVRITWSQTALYNYNFGVFIGTDNV